MSRFLISPFVFLSILVAPTLQADEGMWMPQQIPALGDELKAMGLQLDPASFADLTGFPMGAIVDTNGCSATFVSPEGLIVTNHHCVHGALQYNSTADRDLIAKGFLATTRADEPQASPSTRVYVTTKIEDVTAKVSGVLKKKIGDAERAKT
ncbi:MAG: S46 family peptidase, partial [Thermoanaerobaculia bacterium]|nr:S46 family peptidase [Thermoanaerobaculia bacterium]